MPKLLTAGQRPGHRGRAGLPRQERGAKWTSGTRARTTRRSEGSDWVMPTSSPLPGHEHGAGGDKGNAEPVGNGKPLAEESDPEQGDQDHAQLVDRRHARRVTELECAEVADPRPARSQAGEHEEQIAAPRNRSGWLPLASADENGAQHQQDDDRANEGREIGVDVLDADFGEDGRERRECGRQQRPQLPGQEGRFHGAALTPFGPYWITCTFSVVTPPLPIIGSSAIRN